MKILLFTFLLGFLPPAHPSQPTTLLQTFMQDAVSLQLTDTELADKYFCTAVLHCTDEYGAKARQSLAWALTTQRAFLRKQQVTADEVTFAAFDELPANELPPKPFHMLGETAQVYVARYHGKILSYFLLQGDRIASTLLLNQGGEHYFLDFCH